MESAVRGLTPAQSKILSECTNDFSDSQNDAFWEDLTRKLNSMDGAVKTAERWKRTWQDMKGLPRKRGLKMTEADMYGDNEEDFMSPPKRKLGSFDEEIIRIEKDKLELDRQYKTQKIEVLSRIASALEEIARKSS